VTDRLFVYGTLRAAAGHPMHQLIDRWATFEGLGSVQGRLYDLGAYPAAVLMPNTSDRVHGEVWCLKPDPGPLISLLDRYEGIRPNARDAALYERVVLPVRFSDGRETPAMVYVYRGTLSGQPAVSSGDWLAHRRDRP
jgi:gamma-glutamylcyclotransferase (GGCT)/AIG2-like uncharacterized protein YtfP